MRLLVSTALVGVCEEMETVLHYAGFFHNLARQRYTKMLILGDGGMFL